jgi:hypothetical protein
MTARRLRPLATGLLLLVAAAALSACTEVESAAVEGYQPVELTEVKGSDHQLVTFTPEGADRVGLRTAAVERRGDRLAVPAAAVLYDAGGQAFVYAVKEPRTFQRVDVEVDRAAGGALLLARGPAAGDAVVTTGAPEVHGADNDIAGSH